MQRNVVVLSVVLSAGLFSGGAEAASPGVLRSGGYEWQANPPKKKMNRATAESYCDRLSLAGGGWRLPEKDELMKLWSLGNASGEGVYWSATPFAGTKYAIYVDFDIGDWKFAGWGVEHRVRCVR